VSGEPTPRTASGVGEEFGLRGFHDWIWRNGNVPFALLRLELLGDRSDLDRLDDLREAAGLPRLPLASASQRGGG